MHIFLMCLQLRYDIEPLITVLAFEWVNLIFLFVVWLPIQLTFFFNELRLGQDWLVFVRVLSLRILWKTILLQHFLQHLLDVLLRQLKWWQLCPLPLPTGSFSLLMVRHDLS